MLSPADVLGDAVTVLREQADAATDGHRMTVTSDEYPGAAHLLLISQRMSGRIDSEGDADLWAAWGPAETRLVAGLLATVADGMRHDDAVEVRHPDGQWMVVPEEFGQFDAADANWLRADYDLWTAALALARAVTGHAAPGDRVHRGDTVSETHDCPRPGCGRQVPHSQFACRNHWFQLPKELRDAIWSGYRSGDVRAHVRAMSAAKQWYRDDREAQS